MVSHPEGACAKCKAERASMLNGIGRLAQRVTALEAALGVAVQRLNGYLGAAEGDPEPSENETKRLVCDMITVLGYQGWATEPVDVAAELVQLRRRGALSEQMAGLAERMVDHAIVMVKPLVEAERALLERRHGSTCSKQGERAVDVCPECFLGQYEDEASF